MPFGCPALKHAERSTGFRVAANEKSAYRVLRLKCQHNASPHPRNVKQYPARYAQKLARVARVVTFSSLPIASSQRVITSNSRRSPLVGCRGPSVGTNFCTRGFAE